MIKTKILPVLIIPLMLFGEHVQAEEKYNIELNIPAMMQDWGYEAPEAPYSRWKFTDEEKVLLAQTMESEAGTEGEIGLTLVADVILNRIESNQFPDTIEEVVFQPGQFQPAEDGRLWEVEPSETCWKIIEGIETEYYGITEALYFCETNSDRWHETQEYLFSYRNHKFYR